MVLNRALMVSFCINWQNVKIARTPMASRGVARNSIQPPLPTNHAFVIQLHAQSPETPMASVGGTKPGYLKPRSHDRVELHIYGTPPEGAAKIAFAARKPVPTVEGKQKGKRGARP
jgi:hypothetical protein